MKEIVLGGGCFWCIEAVFNRVEGVLSAVSGYAGGKTPDPTYEDVSSGKTDHVEVVKVVFDETIVTLEDLLRIFFKAHDPTSFDKQGNDVGEQYRSVVFCGDDDQCEKVTRYIDSIRNNYENEIVTDIRKLDNFYDAEEYHQEYYEKNVNSRYCRFVIDPKLSKVFESEDH